MSRFGWGLVAAAVLVTVAGCAGPAEAPGQPPGKLSIEPAWTSCTAEAPMQSWLAPSGRRPSEPARSGDPQTLPRLDDSFRPVAAIVCPWAGPIPPGDGTATERRADDVTALVAALRLPDEPLSGDPCTLEGYLLPWFALLDEQGRWTRVRPPTDACGKARAEFRDAIQGLRLIPASTGPTPRAESAEAAAAGCPPQWAELVGVTAARATAGGPAVVPPGFDGPVRVRLCVYRVPAEQQRTGKPAGDFVSGRYLGDEQWAGVRREIESAGAAAVCTTPADRFAVLHFGAGQISAELDGCRRLLATAADGSETIRQASPALVALLTAR
jgi:hypothetical protein